MFIFKKMVSYNIGGIRIVVAAKPKLILTTTLTTFITHVASAIILIDMIFVTLYYGIPLPSLTCEGGSNENGIVDKNDCKKHFKFLAQKRSFWPQDW